MRIIVGKVHLACGRRLRYFVSESVMFDLKPQRSNWCEQVKEIAVGSVPG